MNKKHQSVSLKQEAFNNIKRKHGIIKDWISKGVPFLQDDNNKLVRDADGEKILDFYPTSLRRFYPWDGTQNHPKAHKDIINISGTGTTTLDAYPELKDEIESDLNTLKLKGKIQSEDSSKSYEIQRVSNQLILEQMQRSSAEKKYLGIHMEHEELKLSLSEAVRENEQANKLYEKMLNKKNAKIIELNTTIAELRKSLSKVSTLKTVDI